MILAYADCLKDHPIMSLGYVLIRSREGDENLLETGTRVFDIEEDERDIRWTTGRGEYMAGIVATRAALDHTSEPFILHLDNAGVVKSIRNDTWNHETYFPHCLRSFLHRFNDYHVRVVHRQQNEKAHRQANVGLQVGREIESGLA